MLPWPRVAAPPGRAPEWRWCHRRGAPARQPACASGPMRYRNADSLLPTFHIDQAHRGGLVSVVRPAPAIGHQTHRGHLLFGHETSLYLAGSVHDDPARARLHLAGLEGVLVRREGHVPCPLGSGRGEVEVVPVTHRAGLLGVAEVTDLHRNLGQAEFEGGIPTVVSLGDDRILPMVDGDEDGVLDPVLGDVVEEVNPVLAVLVAMPARQLAPGAIEGGHGTGGQRPCLLAGHVGAITSSALEVSALDSRRPPGA